MGALRPLAVARDYAGIHAAFRQYIEDINISRALIDYTTGWADGLAGKVLAPKPDKGMGRTTLGPFLEATGLVLIVAQDVDAFDQRRHRLVARQVNQARTGDAHWRSRPRKANKKPKVKSKCRREGKYA